MDRILTWQFWKSALIRSLHTFAQTAVSLIVMGATFAEIDWLHVASVSGVAAVISLLKSIAVGVPESDAEPLLVTFTPEHKEDAMFLDKETIEQIEEEAKGEEPNE